jgi:hypothetical protein
VELGVNNVYSEGEKEESKGEEEESEGEGVSKRLSVWG